MSRALRVLASAALLAGCSAVDQALEVAKPIASQVGAGGYVESAQKGAKAGGLLAKSASSFDPDQEYHIGRAVAAQMLTNPKLRISGRQDLQQYVSNVGQSIALGAPSVTPTYQGYRFVLLESPTVNALSAPGGYVFITTGAVAAARNEEELAGVLAHEVAHVQLHHGIKAIKQSNFTEAMKIIGTEAAGQSGVQVGTVFGDSVQDIVATVVTSGYSRAQEAEADQLAMQLLAEAGYSQQGLVDYLKRNDFDTGGFKSTHPSAADRVAALEPIAARQPAPAGVDKRTARFKQAVGSTS
jgi:predicted Zn-dependent protease